MSSSSSHSDTITGIHLPDISPRSLSYFMLRALTDALSGKPGRVADLTALVGGIMLSVPILRSSDSCYSMARSSCSVPIDAVTFLHYVEHIVDIPGMRVARYQVPVVENGCRIWRPMEEFDTSGDGAHANWHRSLLRENRR